MAQYTKSITKFKNLKYRKRKNETWRRLAKVDKATWFNQGKHKILLLENRSQFCYKLKIVLPCPQDGKKSICLLNPNFLKYYAFNLYENKNGFSTANGDFSHCLSGIPFMFEVTLN